MIAVILLVDEKDMIAHPVADEEILPDDTPQGVPPAGRLLHHLCNPLLNLSVDSAAQDRPEQALQILCTGVLDRLPAAKMLQQEPAAPWADARDPVECAT